MKPEPEACAVYGCAPLPWPKNCLKKGSLPKGYCCTPCTVDLMSTTDGSACLTAVMMRCSKSGLTTPRNDAAAATLFVCVDAVPSSLPEPQATMSAPISTPRIPVSAKPIDVRVCDAM